MPIYALDAVSSDLPDVGQFWIAPDAHVIGRVRLGIDAGIWFGTVLRGDNEPISVREATCKKAPCFTPIPASQW